MQRELVEARTSEAIMLRQAIADTDWETLERYGGFDAAVKKVLRTEEETRSLDDRGMIHDFRLGGGTPVPSYRWTTYKWGWSTEVVHFASNHNAFLERGRAFPAGDHADEPLVTRKAVRRRDPNRLAARNRVALERQGELARGPRADQFAPRPHRRHHH